jgi:hypothetical protein
VTTPEGEHVTRNLAADHPDIVRRLDGHLREWAAGLSPPGLFTEPSGFSRHHENLFVEHGLITPSDRVKAAAPPP